MIANGKNHVKNYALFVAVQGLRGAKNRLGRCPAGTARSRLASETAGYASPREITVSMLVTLAMFSNGLPVSSG